MRVARAARLQNCRAARAARAARLFFLIQPIRSLVYGIAFIVSSYLRPEATDDLIIEVLFLF